MKDKVEPLDKTGAVYYNDCKKHRNPKQDYVGETDRVVRKRLYEHRIVDHKTAERSASIIHVEKEAESRGPLGERRSQRQKGKKKINYKTMQEGSNQLLSEGNTEFSAHVASDIHEKSDLNWKILCTEENWFARGVKEAIAIRKIRPTLNGDGGRYHLSSIYDKLIGTKLDFKIPSLGMDDATVHQGS